MGRWCGWVAALLLALTVLTGYGITQFRVVTPLTAGLLGKAVAQRWHHYTDIPLVAALCVHVGIALWMRWGRRR